MPLSWNEIKSRALKFSKEWDNDSSERAEAKTFWDEFFNIFGISRRRVATFEKPVTRLDESIGFIDLLWKGVLLVEHKSKGKNLDKAFTQAKDYFPGIAEHELPQFILVTDFDKFRLYNLEDDTKEEFHLHELHTKIHLFDFVLGYKRQEFKEEDPVNIAAANLMGLLHDALKSNGYEGHDLERFLVRILFILFADDTGIFQPIGHFDFFLKNRTSADGSDLGSQIAHIFQILNTHEDKRQSNLDEDINAFPYVNGDLFKESLPITSFDSDMRSTLLQCSSFDWSKISPAIFGSLFQSVMDKDKRRDLGAHYTSEKNIMKVIKSLFLDELHAEFEDSKTNSNKLEKYYDKISKLKFFDPACGCGNFLIIAYRELRLLEIEVLKHLFKLSPSMQLPMGLSRIDVDCMYGIEIEEFPSRIAEVAMWLLDHQMNLRLSEQFGSYFARIPLKKSAQIINGNSLQLDWNTILPKEDCSYILGNPPFIGKKRRDDEQNKDMDLIFKDIKNYGVLDYVCAWYIKAAEFIKDTNIKVAFVSTNSISQGEQVGILWSHLLKENIQIHFAHRTFKWDNEAKGKAAVHVVIIGFSIYDTKSKSLFDYEDIKADPVEIKAKNINPYLVDSDNLIILSRNNPICNVPEIKFGSMPNDDGNFIFTDEERLQFLSVEPKAEKFIKHLMSAREFLHNENRWCLWLEDIKPSEIKELPEVEKKIERVKTFRQSSNREATRKLASYPYLFGENRQPKSDYILIPRHTSENRKYIPIAYLPKDNIVSDSCLSIQNASYYHFGILTSAMHMVWVRQICGRIKSDYRYSNNLVYNNYPWPDQPTNDKLKRVEEEVTNLLSVREEYRNESLADLYDPIAMPKKLVDAHNKLDKAVDLCYRPQPFPNELSRLEFLFDLYKKYTEPLLKEVKKRGKK
ncbi:MAG: class I SAM-dependent DNA methyltransferase [Ignavibacteria bacterium]